MQTHKIQQIVPGYAVSEVQLVYKNRVPYTTRPTIKSSKDAYPLFLGTWDSNKIDLQEQFKVLFLNRCNQALAIAEISCGGITGTVVDTRLILSTALKLHATVLVLCHNHPSGNLSPSVQDEKLTETIKNAAVLLDIRILDHLILSSEGYYSFADEGKL